MYTVSVGLTFAEETPLAPIGELPLGQTGEFPEFCPMEYAPVCGMDGITYSSSCELGIAQRNFVPDLKIDFDGECCGNRMCLIPLLGDGDALKKPLCASDGKIYTSACDFLAAHCIARQQLWPVPRTCCERSSDLSSPICSLPPKGPGGN